MTCRRALALSLLLASVAAPCLADDAPATDLALGDRPIYNAPSGALTTLSGLKSFMAKAVDSPWDVDRAARVEKLLEPPRTGTEVAMRVRLLRGSGRLGHARLSRRRAAYVARLTQRTVRDWIGFPKSA